MSAERVFEHLLEIVPLADFDLVSHLNQLAEEHHWEIVAANQVMVNVSPVAPHPQPGLHLLFKRQKVKSSMLANGNTMDS